MTTHRARVTGSTKAIKEQLKRDGWRWNADKTRWFCSLSEVHASQLLAEETREETLARFCWHYKGCEVTVDGTVVFSCPTFAAPVAKALPAGWCVDLEDGRAKPRHECDIAS